MPTRSGGVYFGNPVKVKKSFNMIGRATDVSPNSILYTSNKNLIDLANVWKVKVENRTVSVGDVYSIQEELKKSHAGVVYLVIDFGKDWLYLHPAPLEGRGARVNAAAPKAGAVYADASNNDTVIVDVAWGSIPANGKENPTRDAVMGGTARNYAMSVYDHDFAEGRSWEWLHIVGHSLGGDNEVDNLVAGTYTANTQMIPYENEIKKTLLQGGSVKCRYSYECYPETRVAMYIQMEMEITLAQKITPLAGYFNATGDLPFDKFQYVAARFR